MQYLKWGRIKVLYNKFNTPMVLEHLFDMFVV